MNISDDLLRRIAQYRATYAKTPTAIYLGTDKWYELINHRAANLFLQFDPGVGLKFYGTPTHHVVTQNDHVGIA